MNKVCPICNNREIIKPGSGLNNYYSCPRCVSAWIKGKESVNYGLDYYTGSSSLLSYLFSPLLYIFYYLRKKVVSGKKINTWVDVGAGDGAFLNFIKSDRKIGVEASSSGRNKITALGQEAMTGNEFLKSEKLNADVISFWHSLEHIDQPGLYLKAAFNNLNKNGQLIIALPNFDSWERKYFKKHWFHLAPQYHKWHFSISSLEYILNSAGFKIKKTHYWCPEHHLSGLLQSVINQSTSSQNILHKSIKRQSKRSMISISDWLWCAFWVSIGFPIVLMIWIINSLTKKSGAIIVVAEKR